MLILTWKTYPGMASTKIRDHISVTLIHTSVLCIFTKFWQLVPTAAVCFKGCLKSCVLKAI